jgi:hypothetical protein
LSVFTRPGPKTVEKIKSDILLTDAAAADQKADKKVEEKTDKKPEKTK